MSTVKKKKKTCRNGLLPEDAFIRHLQGILTYFFSILCFVISFLGQPKKSNVFHWWSIPFGFVISRSGLLPLPHKSGIHCTWINIYSHTLKWHHNYPVVLLPWHLFCPQIDLQSVKNQWVRTKAIFIKESHKEMINTSPWIMMIIPARIAL